MLKYRRFIILIQVCIVEPTMFGTMRIFIIFSVTIAVTVTVPTFNSKWQNFKLTHNRSYNHAEDLRRSIIFEENLAKIAAHNRLYDQGLATYKMGVNQFTDWTFNEFRNYLGNSIEVQDDTLNRIQSTNELPEHVDWREKNAVTPVQNQGEFAGSWPFSAVGALEGQFAIENHELVALSNQELIDCVNNSRGDILTAYRYVMDYGLTSQQEYPNQQQIHTCQRGSEPAILYIRGYVRSTGINDIYLQDEIANKGPVTAFVDATNWQFYSNGVFNGECSSTLLNHYALIVGYAKDENDGYYIVKNSWGQQWGENGYIRLPLNKCGITRDVTYPEI